jgi:hypothetical protein
MGLRNLTFALGLSGASNAVSQLVDVKKRMDDVDGRVAQSVVNIVVAGQPALQAANTAAASATKSISGASQAANGALDGLKAGAGAVAGVVQDVGSKGVGAFKAIGNTVNEVAGNVGKLMTSMAAMAAGGAVAGLSWLSAAKSKLYLEEVYKAVDANKKLGISSDQLKDHIAKSMAEAPGWETKGTATEETYNMLQYAGKYLGKGEKGLNNAENISKAYFANQEAMQKAGFGSADDLVRIAARNTQLRPDQLMGLKAAGLTDADIGSPQKRLKALEKLGLKVDIKAELDKRPWIEAQNNVDKLQKSIGTSLAPVLTRVSEIVANIAGGLAENPDASWLIGMGAVAVTAVGALSMLVGVFGPLVGLVRTLGVVTKVMAAAQWLLNIALDANPIGVIVMGLVILGVALYAVEQKTHIFSKALQYLANTGMGQGIIAWVNGVKDSLGSIWSKAKGPGVMKFLADISAPGGISKSLGLLVTYLYNLVYGNSTVSKVLNYAKGLWQSASDFLGGLWDTLKSMWSWLMNAIPGAKKEGYRQELEKKLPSGMQLTPQGEIWWKAGGKPKVPGAVESDSDRETRLAAHKVDASEIPPKLQTLYANYQNAPGFAEGVAEAVRQGLSGMGDILKTAVKDGIGGLVMSIPGMQALSDAIARLTGWLDAHGAPATQAVQSVTSAAAVTGENMLGSAVFGPLYPLGKSIYGAFQKPQEPSKQSAMSADDKLKELRAAGLSEADIKLDMHSLGYTGYAKGGVVRRSGWLDGPVHTGEIVPAAQVDKWQGSNAGITINAPISIRIDKVEKDVDINNLVFKVRSELERLSARGLGYQRGGTIGH